MMLREAHSQYAPLPHYYLYLCRVFGLASV